MCCYSAAAQSLPGAGNALRFNGSSTYINAGVDNRGVTSRITVEAWIKTRSEAIQFAATKYSNSNFEDRGFQLGTSAGFAIFNGRAGKGQYYGSGSSRTYVADGRWHHIAGVCDDNVWKIYVDGTLESTTTFPYTNGNLASTYALSLGSYFVLNNWYFDGDIDEIRVWRAALTQDQIRTNMCRKISPVPAELVAYYSFDQTSGLTAIDKGSVPTNGTLSNFSTSSPWQPSGAAIGDVSVFAYGSDLRATRLNLAAANGDSGIVRNISTQTDGVQLYAVNQASSMVIPFSGTTSPVYFGVFSRGSTGTYDFRLRPAGGLLCTSLYERPASDGAWTNTVATSTSSSLLLTQQRYRAEYTQVGADLRALPVTVLGDTILCAGGSVQLTASISGGANSFRWNTGAVAQTITVTQPGIYSMTATFPSGCTITRSRQVVQADLRITGETILCEGASSTLRAVSTPAGATFRWNNGATTSDLSVTQPGTYSVTTTFSNGCTSTRQVVVSLSKAVPAFALGPDTTVCEGTPLLLRAPVGNAYTYLWSDGSTGSSLLARQGGTYTVTVRSGCNTQTASRTLTAQLCVPNIITPNKDGRNDAFVVASYNVGEWSLAIYNRWGKEVYQTERYLNDWGASAAPGVYYYMLRRGTTNSAIKGWLEVVR
ncbi:hypothetical protein GCM10011375_19380 [Hymenobacter qilianensis]|uniref:Uncharacterized protein n=2 Tax=Hymenobacter qilianensis TaxID=1385715 RepID=A0ACB5PRC0_9BACT|nr:LamG-like jellyroll fold domain-containing protein [Hymenobacter qilianensis]QNP52116.1 gliding motility-associated C-terminal domain-containing protein [Hymenobacter qilianensis]GGF64589.1 hypothetical protein GCM10011375_19380 [Hymenobacter qilianensis]